MGCKKLCDTLSTYFVRSPFLWERPLAHLALSFANGRFYDADYVQDASSSMSNVIQQLSPLQLSVLMWVADRLVVDVAKVDSNTPAHANMHNEMERTANDVRTLLDWCFRYPENGSNPSPKREALRCFVTWMDYVQPNWHRRPELASTFRSLFGQAIGCLLDETLFDEAIAQLRDMLDSNSSSFEPSDFDVLANILQDRIQPKLQQALLHEDPGATALVQFVVALGCADLEHIIEHPNDSRRSQSILNVLVSILSMDGYVGRNDVLSALTVEFWNTYIEWVNDHLGSREEGDPEYEWLPHTKNVMMRVVELLWKKMLTPSQEDANDWDDEEKEGLKEFRLDASDLIQSISALLGKQMVRQFVALTMQSLELKLWSAVEAALFCLSGLADNVLDSESDDDLVGPIFTSSIFRELTVFDDITIPHRTRRTAIDMLNSYSPYIKQHLSYLPETIRYLFGALSIDGLAISASKAVEALCSTCRTKLMNELDWFLAQYQSFLNAPTCDLGTKMKIIGAIACIIQARTPDSAKVQPLLALLSTVEQDIAMAKQYAVTGNEEMAKAFGVSALESLAGIGKGMQVPDDQAVIDIEDGEEQAGRSNYWESEEGLAIQQRITSCFSVLEVVGRYSEGISAACQVLKSGFRESEPGPFVLPPLVTVNFVNQCSMDTPQLETVLATACMLITQHSQVHSKRIDAEVASIYARVREFISTLRISGNDPEQAAAYLDVLVRMMPYYTHILLANIDGPTLSFALSAIQGAETAPKRSGCDFWNKLIGPQTLSAEAKQRLDQLMIRYGPELAKCLMFQIGGDAQRSELDFVCEPLKLLLLHQPSAKMWLQQGLANDAFPNPSITPDDRVRYLRQLAAAGSDGRKIKAVTKVFWAKCRGTVVSY